MVFEGMEPGGASSKVATAKPTSITWSYSRRSALEQCPLSYYFEYYGTKKRAAVAEPRKEQLRYLKGLRSRHLRAGEIVHRVIRTYLNRLREGEEWSLERLIVWARDMLHADLAFSRAYRPDEPLPSGPKAPVLLSEFYYGAVDARQLLEETEERLVAALTNFVGSPKIEPFRVGAIHPDAVVEKHFNLKQGRFSIKGMMDLAYPLEAEGRVAVVDWKTGGAGSSDDVLQLYSYALEAARRFGCGLADLGLYRVGLADDEVYPFVIGERDAARAKVRIMQDLETMAELDPYGREGVAAAFTPCAQRRICAQCKYQQYCPKEE